MLIGHRANSTTSAVGVAQAVMIIQGRGKNRTIMTEKEPVTYRVACAAAAAAAVAAVAAAAAVHTSVLGVDSSETMRAGLVQPQIHLAVRHPASFRPS